MKLLVPLKINTVLPKGEVLIAPPQVAELLKLLVPVKVSTALFMLIAPPMNVSKVLVPAYIAPPSSAELLMKLLVPLKVCTGLYSV